MSHSSAIMETKNRSLQKRFSAHVSSCFGVIRHDDELLRPPTPPSRPRTFSLRRSSITWEQQLVWKPYDAYSDMKSMAHGSEARTHLTKSMTTGRVYIVKRFTQYPVFSEQPISHQGDQPLPNEATVLLKALRPHPSILRAFGYDCFGGMISNLYTEHCSRGDLAEQMLHFHKINRMPPERFVLHVFISLAHALCYIHNGLRWDPEEKVYWQEPGFNTPYIHADVKLENAFPSWTDDAVRRGLPNVILGDFGHAQPANNFRGIAGTTGYQAPELAVIYRLRQTDRQAFRVAMKTTGYVTPAADVFSLGQSIHRLCTGREHRVGADPEALPVRDTKHGMIGVKVGGRRGYQTEALQKTVQWCLRKDPGMRPKTVEGSLLGAVAIFQEALEELESSPMIPCEMWVSPP